jgi:beta-xylosidase
MTALAPRLARLRRRIFSLYPLTAAALIALAACPSHIAAQTTAPQYKNPVLFADYSDPDVIRVGKDYYLIASSFHFSPGLPILHSLDLVHWEIAGHALPRLTFSPRYDMSGGMRYAGGVWAPSVRFHNGLFYIYFPTPDEGIFVVTAPKMTGPWSAPVAVIAGPGWEDPCPFWDDDGQAYLVHSKLRAGPLILHRMAPDGKSVLDAGRIIVQDPEHLPTLEGPKFYKRNGWYYIFAPMGGVGRGSQAVLRSRNIYGPYDYRIVLAQGSTKVNGPHQGGYVETPDGRGWFLHFSQHGAHGRIVYLEPVRWENDWPVIGEAPAGAETGQPVAEAPMPVIAPGAAKMHPQTSDEFNERTLPPMWEWNHNPDDAHWSLTEHRGYLRLHAMPAADLMHARNTLTECMQDDSLQFITRIDVEHLRDGDRAGLSLFDKSLSYIGVAQAGAKRTIVFSIKGEDTPGPELRAKSLQLRARVNDDTVDYSYSLDGGRSFQPLGTPVKLAFSWWKGARPALFAFHADPSGAASEPAGYADFDWARYQALTTETAASAQ